MPRVLFDGQIFSIHKRGGIARLFFRVHNESLSSPDRRGDGRYVTKGVIFSQYSEDKKDGWWKFPVILSGRGVAKFSLTVNWLCLWVTPYRILHSTFYFRPYLWRRPGTKHVVTLHDMIPEDFPEDFPNGNPHNDKELFLRDADRIVCVSNYTKSRLNHHYPDLTHKAIVISSGVEIPYFDEPKVERNSTLLYVGRRGGYKDFSTLLRALPIVLESHPTIQILAVGDQDFSDDEMALISELKISGKVFRKELSDHELQRAYRESLLTVVTSHVEGFGLPVIEAMANKSIVVATEIPVFREISGDAFVPFIAGNAADLALKIKEVLNNSSKFEGLRAKGTAVAHQYSWKNVWYLLHKLYEEI